DLQSSFDSAIVASVTSSLLWGTGTISSLSENKRNA
uniref:Uncharacterized protein n=1 Tax=Amphimedon queenslandica TaxID=400682 RepID=A0A1X7VVG4_AMPQE